MKDMHNEEEGDGLAVPLPDRLAGTHRRPAGRVRDLLPRLPPPSGSLVGLGLLLQLNDRRAKLVGDGMADRVPLSNLPCLFCFHVRSSPARTTPTPSIPSAKQFCLPLLENFFVFLRHPLLHRYYKSPRI